VNVLTPTMSGGTIAAVAAFPTTTAAGVSGTYVTSPTGYSNGPVVQVVLSYIFLCVFSSIG
jgi:hypothetical protein